MKNTFLAAFALFMCAVSAQAQSKSNDVIYTQIKSSDAGRHITLTYDASSNMSKIMAVAPNFSDRDAHDAGLMAMNFAAGTYYSGTVLQRSPDPIMLTFWVMSKKPRFAASHRFSMQTGAETLDLGEGRYAAKAYNNMEYLNFELSRENLAKIVARGSQPFALGDFKFTFTAEQLKMLADVLRLSDATR